MFIRLEAIRKAGTRASLCSEMTFGFTFTDRVLFEMAWAVVLQLIPLFFCCGKFLWISLTAKLNVFSRGYIAIDLEIASCVFRWSGCSEVSCTDLHVRSTETPHITHCNPVSLPILFLPIFSLQCTELTSSMATLNCLPHNRTWRWPSGLVILECTVLSPRL